MFKLNNWIVGTFRVTEHMGLSYIQLNVNSMCISEWRIDIPLWGYENSFSMTTLSSKTYSIARYLHILLCVSATSDMFV